jgi:hypothetical protein
MSRFLGILLLLAGVYFLGKNIFFATYYSPYFWRNLPALGSALTMIGGVVSLLFFRRETGNLGWILLMISVVLVFLSGGISLRPTSLWNFFLGFVALAGGYQLLSTGRIRF